MRNFKDVDKAAEELLRKSGCPKLENGTAVDVVRIVREFCNFDLAEIPDLNLDGPVLGAYLPAYNAVLVKANCIETRKRFSIAHELGHAQLEYNYGAADPLFPLEQPQYFRCEESDIDDLTATKPRVLAEILANKFAAQLLMPETLVREVWKTCRDVKRCALGLQVSRQALTYRLKTLRLIQDSQDAI